VWEPGTANGILRLTPAGLRHREWLARLSITVTTLSAPCSTYGKAITVSKQPALIDQPQHDRRAAWLKLACRLPIPSVGRDKLLSKRGSHRRPQAGGVRVPALIRPCNARPRRVDLHCESRARSREPAAQRPRAFAPGCGASPALDPVFPTTDGNPRRRIYVSLPLSGSAPTSRATTVRSRPKNADISR
jgi:hypothetical protein